MGILREGTETIFDTPLLPAVELLDDINKIRVRNAMLGDEGFKGCLGRRYDSYPESHHLEEEER